MSDIENYLSRIVTEYRRRSGLSLDQMAEKSGVSRSLIYQVEIGKTVPTLGSLRKIAQAMEMGLQELVAPLDGDKSVIKGNLKEIAPYHSKDKSFVSLPIHSLLENHDTEFFKFYFVRKGQHQAIRGAGTCVTLFVEKGELVLIESGRETILRGGDVAEFFPNRFYTYCQRTSRLARGDVMITRI